MDASASAMRDYADQVCPKCRTTKYRNPHMKLMVNVCGHNLCESCVELLFVKGSGSCPECGIALRRNNFRVQLFEDANIDKEVDIRRRILRDFNKKEEDFDSLRKYNDYLEMVEDIIFNLCNNIDILETNKQIAAYKEANKEFIHKNKHKRSKEELQLEEIIFEENRLSEIRRKEMEDEARHERLLKAAHKEQLIDDLMFSDSSAAAIVADHRSKMTDDRPKFSSDLHPSTSLRAAAQMTSSRVEDVPFVYEEFELFFDGPTPPGGHEIIECEYTAHVKCADASEIAAGYVEGIACLRSVQEAMSGLFYWPTGAADDR